MALRPVEASLNRSATTATFLRANFLFSLFVSDSDGLQPMAGHSAGELAGVVQQLLRRA